MMQKGLNKFDAARLSYLGILTYQRRLCGEETIPARGLEQIWEHYKSEGRIDEATKDLEVDGYADALEAELPGAERLDKIGYCNSVRRRFPDLKVELLQK